MINKRNRYKKLIQQFEYECPQFQILKELGRGRHGVAYELVDGNVINLP